MNVLFLTHRLPYAPNRGDRIRAFHLLRYLQSVARVHLISLVHDETETAHVHDLAGLTASVRVARVPRVRNLVRSAIGLAGGRPTTHTMLYSPDVAAAIRSAVADQPPDAVIAYCSGMARYALEPPLAERPLLLDMVDVDSAKWRDLAAVTSGPRRWVYRREARVLGAFEARAARHASSTLVVTPRERDTLAGLAPAARIEVVPNGVDIEFLRPVDDPRHTTDVVFCGVMNYAPNEQAAQWLAGVVWPMVRRQRPAATLSIVGSAPTSAVRALAAADRGIRVTGAVPDVRPFLWNAAVAVAPIVTARGIQNKVLEAVAAGLPVVVTPNLVEALPEQVRPAVRAAATPAELADAIVRLLDLPPEERRALARRADVASLTWERQLHPVGALLEEAVQAGRRRRAGPTEPAA